MEKEKRAEKKFIYLVLILFILININLILSQITTPATTTNTFNYGYNTNPYSTPYSTNYPFGYNANYNYPSDYNYNQNYYNNYYNQNGYTYNPNYGSYNYFGGGYNQNYGNYYGGYDYYSYTNPSVFWPNYNTDTCNGVQNVVLQIAPGGCSPMVVRSDLLEDQNVPVFCKLMSINANPLINVMRIRSVNFQGQYPKGVSGISYFPSRSAISTRVGTDSLMSSPINTDLGYMVIVLARQPNENNMSDFIEGNITANIAFDSEGSYGVGQTVMYASPMTDADWSGRYMDYSFWNGRAYIRADAVEKDKATISIYRDFNSKQSSVTLKAGETSRDIYLNGFYCGAGLNIRVDKIDVPVERALLQINDQQIWVSIGDKVIDDRCRITSLSSSGLGGKISISCPVTNGKIDLSLGTIANTSVSVVPLQEGVAFEYYDKAIRTYSDLYNLYPNDYRISGEDPYAAIGLYEGAELSKKFGMNDKAVEFYDKLKKNYPNSRLANIADTQESYMRNYDTRNSKANIVINNRQYFIDLLDFKKPSISDLSVVLSIDGKEQTFAINDVSNLVSDGSKNIQIMDIKTTGVNIKYTKISSGKPESKTITLVPGKSEQTSLDNFNIKLVNINSNRQVKLSLIPVTLGQRGQSSFMFRVGIEKRAIKLTPEQTKDIMKNLLSAIKQWNDINQKLGKVISIMKTACFATSAILTAKTMLNGLDGSAIARNNLMNGASGWYQTCEKLVNEKTYSTVQQCLLDKNSEIEKDIQIYGNQINKMNNVISQIEKTSKKNGVIDNSLLQSGFKSNFDNFCKDAQGSVSLPDKTSVGFTGENGICSWQNLTFDQRRDIMTYYNTRNSGSSVLKDVSDRELGKTVLDAKNYHDSISDLTKSQQANNLGINTLVPTGDSVLRGDIKRVSSTDRTNNVFKNFKEGSNVVRVFIPAAKTFGNKQFTAHADVAGKEVIVEVKESGGAKGVFSPNGAVYTAEGKEVTGDALKSVREYMSLSNMDRVKTVDLRDYKNPIKNPEKLFVKYFETAPFKGLPAEVPFDVNEGWYVELQYIIGGFGKPYDESGKAVNYYICNVGPNGLIEFKKSADDICRYYNGNTGASLDFPGLSTSESNRLIQRAQQAIADAARQYGKETVTINGKTFKSGKSFGEGEGRCTDFMSASDCTLLFNVCDPVICPSSRCDLGGKYKVDNVVQSGVIGSLMLCLPNSREGIAIPFCLTGIHAGLEGFISILNSTVQCLNESLETGRNVGVCDEIKSIYICEFFWKQAAPFLNMVIPAIFEGFYGQTRGGGEYLTVQTAWNNAQGAANWFTSQYASNSMQAFQYRSINNAGVSTGGDVGAEFCQSFISLNTGQIENLFENLIAPDSPAQYHAWFSEDILTTATVPATSHYKVYYHIYAGKDIGSSYVVYLTGLSSTGTTGIGITGSTFGTSVLGSYGGIGTGIGSGIYTSGYYTVASGYVTRGNQVDEARDFTAPAGFKQVCININGKDNCGFGQVSTSYMLNSITDAYVKEQTQSVITTEKECVAGTSSIYSMANPNLQSGVQNVIEPQLYNSGIIRVCATDNPGKQVATVSTSSAYGTNYTIWQDVGYCGDSKLRCWLDTNSVKAVVKNTGIQSQILNTGNVNLINQNIISSEESFSAVSLAESQIDNLMISKTDTKETIEGKISTIVSTLTDISKSAPTNVLRARSLYSLGRLYKRVAESLVSSVNFGDISGTQAETITTIPSTTEPIGGTGTVSTATSSKVENSDIQELTSESGETLFKIKIFENGEFKDYYLTSFDYENQVVLLVDGSTKKVSKDSQGRIIFGNSGGSVTAAASIQYVFEFQDGTAEANIFYKFENGVWYWGDSVSTINWINVDDDERIVDLSYKDQAFIISLRNKNCNEGLKLLVTRMIKNEEGGWFANANLVVHKGNAYRNFVYNQPSDIDCSNLDKLFA